MLRKMKKILLAMVVIAGMISGLQAQNWRPNILWLTCEDISPTLSMYGDSTAHTPNLDRLAAEGLVFDNVYAVVAVCAPSRSSLITGMYPTSIGTMHMRTAHDVMSWGKREYSGKSNAVDISGDTVPLYSAVIPPYVKCFTEYLREAGYYCTNNQKTDYQFAAPVTAWDFITSHSSASNFPGLLRISLGTSVLPRSWKSPAMPRSARACRESPRRWPKAMA
jgi:arylsulfatase A-like enzyme